MRELQRLRTEHKGRLRRAYESWFSFDDKRLSENFFVNW